MATVTPVNRPRGQTRGGVSAVLRYVMKEEKTEYEDRHLVTGLNCQPECCYTEFISTKLQHGKCDGKMYFHFVQSFHPEEPVTPEVVHQIALELAEQWKGYEVIVATHTDREHLHSHLIVNSVSFETGRKLHFGKEDLTQLCKFSDQLCVRHGLSICQPKVKQTVGIGQAEYHTAMRGESWKIKLAIQIDEAMKYAVSKEQFVELMESEGYTVKWTDSRKSITYTTPDGHSCRDYKLHEEKYLKGNMEHEFTIRANYWDSHAGRAESQTADGAPGEYEQGNKSPKVRDAHRGQLDRADPGGGADGAVGPQTTRDGGASDDLRADGREAQRPGVQPAGPAHPSGHGDAERRGEAGGGQHREPGADASGHDGYREQDRTADGGRVEELPITGWENERGSLYGYLQGEGYAGRERQLDDVEDVPAHGHPGALGAGAVSLLAGLSVLDDQSDDPEEKRRQMEAREAAQNLGALIGLAAGAAITIQKLTGDESNMTGPTMKMTMG